ncbi:O-antigen ligase family protein [Anaerocolumna sp.]|jgi:O-antigen ligase|uniref:O-antigen ligase family protein n=1 Tax=Anaerocolumna sp. TaxID=2041569 RepID=UPI0028A78BF6|nr:O-antigen ligase family protein [Anaerocolumna sp.]
MEKIETKYKMVDYLLISLVPLSLLVNVFGTIIRDVRIATVFTLVHIFITGILVIINNTSIQKGLIKESKIMLLFLLFILYLLSLAIFSGHKEINAVVRLGTIFAYNFTYLIFVLRFRNEYEYIYLSYKMILISIIAYLIISNIYYNDFQLHLNQIMGSRYQGILGTNAHGIVSAIGTMFSIVLLRLNHKKIFILSILYTMFNLYITGSRASYLSLILFVLLFDYFLIEKSAIKRFIHIMLAIIFISILVMYIPNLIKLILKKDILQAFRINEFSISGRILPLIFGVETILYNNGLPIGIGKANIDAVLLGRPLDNIYIIIAFEVGIIGLIVFLSFILSVLLKSIKNLRKVAFSDSFTKNEKVIYKFSTIIIIIILFHSIFEAMLFSGFKINTFLLLLLMTLLSKYNYKLKLLK